MVFFTSRLYVVSLGGVVWSSLARCWLWQAVPRMRYEYSHVPENISSNCAWHDQAVWGWLVIRISYKDAMGISDSRIPGVCAACARYQAWSFWWILMSDSRTSWCQCAYPGWVDDWVSKFVSFWSASLEQTKFEIKMLIEQAMKAICCKRILWLLQRINVFKEKI